MFRLLVKPLIGKERALPIEEWASGAPPASSIAVGRLLAWLEEGAAQGGDDAVLVAHSTVAALTDREARALGLPPPPAVQLHVQAEGTIDCQATG